MVNQIEASIHRIITGDNYRHSSLLEYLLFGASLIYKYGAIYNALRCQRHAGNHRKRLPRPVISVGNLTVGGTGKTPMTIFLARLLSRQGWRVTILSRGYGGKAEAKGGMVSDGHQIFMSVEASGDEPQMMSRCLLSHHVAVFVGRNRYESGICAMDKCQPDLFILDDGFQHHRLHRDLDLVLLDYQRPFGNHHTIPRGPLREPVDALARADAIILTRCDRPCDSQTRKDIGRLTDVIGNKPVFRTIHKPYFYHKNQKIVDSLSGLEGFAFSGIAHNTDFHRILIQSGVHLLDHLQFQDHHPYRPSDIQQILQRATASRAQVLLTTEKDYARLDPSIKWPMDLIVVGVDLDFVDGPNSFAHELLRWVERLKPPLA